MTNDQIYSLIGLIPQNAKDRSIDRFSVSDVWAIEHGYLNVDNYLKREPMTNEQVVNTQYGKMMHAYFSDLLSRDGWVIDQKSLKKELQFGGFVLVGIPDAMRNDTIIEIKTSFQKSVVVKDWYLTQVKCYLSMFDRREAHIVEPVFSSDDIYLRLVRRVRRNDEWFENVIKMLDNFNKQLHAQYNTR